MSNKRLRKKLETCRGEVEELKEEITDCKLAKVRRQNKDLQLRLKALEQRDPNAIANLPRRRAENNDPPRRRAVRAQRIPQRQPEVKSDDAPEVLQGRQLFEDDEGVNPPPRRVSVAPARRSRVRVPPEQQPARRRGVNPRSRRAARAQRISQRQLEVKSDDPPEVPQGRQLFEDDGGVNPPPRRVSVAPARRSRFRVPPEQQPARSSGSERMQQDQPWRMGEAARINQNQQQAEYMRQSNEQWGEEQMRESERIRWQAEDMRQSKQNQRRERERIRQQAEDMRRSNELWEEDQMRERERIRQQAEDMRQSNQSWEEDPYSMGSTRQFRQRGLASEEEDSLNQMQSRIDARRTKNNYSRLRF